MDLDGSRFSAKHTLKDGTEVTIRAIRADDKSKFMTAFQQLDRSTIYRRFFGFRNALTDAELDQATNIDFESVVALVATVRPPGGGDEIIVGGGRYIVSSGHETARSAEVAFTVGEAYQGRGVAPLIMNHLVEIGRAKGISFFEAEVLKENAPMLKVFQRTGLPLDRRSAGHGVLHVTMTLEPLSGCS